MLEKIIVFIILVFFVFIPLDGIWAIKILPFDEYGRVIINRHSEKAGFAPVVFDHWLHRAMFTCRLCHVDIGFSMEANETGIDAESNKKGLYCGTCHNGTRIYNKKRIFASCTDRFTEEDKKSRCDRCHSYNREVKKEYIFGVFTERFPKKGLGNGIDWEEAEKIGVIKPIDTIEGISVKRSQLKTREDFTIKSKGTWMSDIIFSHEKHTKWNGCELCHPDIFNVEKETTRFNMFQIYSGQYCGACHGKVAFPVIECDRCHKKR